MKRRRRLPRLDPCKVHLGRLRKLNEHQLMKVWSRLGASTPSRTTANSLLKGIVSNLAAAKSSQGYYNDPKQRRRSMRIYLFIVRRLESEFRSLQRKRCR